MANVTLRELCVDRSRIVDTGHDQIKLHPLSLRSSTAHCTNLKQAGLHG